MNHSITARNATGLTGQNIRELVATMNLDEDRQLWYCLCFALNFTWNVSLVARVLECRWGEVLQVRTKMQNAGLRKGYLDFMFMEDVPDAEKLIGFVCETMVIDGILKSEVIGGKDKKQQRTEWEGLVQYHERRKAMKTWVKDNYEQLTRCLEKGRHVQDNAELKEMLLALRTHAGYKPTYNLQDMLRAVETVMATTRGDAPTPEPQYLAEHRAETNKIWREEVLYPVFLPDFIKDKREDKAAPTPPPRTPLNGKMTPEEYFALGPDNA